MGNNNSRNVNQNIDKYNSFIEKAQKAIMCGSNCQKQKKANELKEKYLASEANLASADNQVYVAEKNYLTFTNYYYRWNGYIYGCNVECRVKRYNYQINY